MLAPCSKHHFSRCGHQTADGLTVVILVMNDVPDGINDMAGRGDVIITGFHLEVAHLSVEGRRHLGHGEIVEESDAVDLQVVSIGNGVDDGARTYKQEHSWFQILLYEIDSDVGTTSRNHSHTEIVDGKGWFVLLDDHQKHVWAAIEHTQFVVDESVLHNLAEVCIVNALHARVVHQFRLFHVLFIFEFAAKIIKKVEITLFLCGNRTKRTFLS